ncbi:MAG: 3-deoxy-D-manno-octulosonic acid transferase [Hyphomicrobiales bacterium]|nr:3-deoxy-D-manno-octulosonic acid transferase [Hyphomicrobiales bacterium]
MRFPLSLGAYRLATLLATPLSGVLLSLRLNKAKEDPLRIEERRGVASLERPEGPLVWLHGASVGEALSLLPLIDRITRSGRHALVTTGTITSARLLAQRLPPGGLHQYAPLDAPRFMRRFFEHWRPDVALIAESELWPNMIVEARRAGVPLVMVNARMSARSYARWRKARTFIQALLRRVDLCLAQSQADAERLADLGAPDVRMTGNLKFDAPAPPADRQELAALSGLTSGRQIWVAASTHAGEERLAAEAHLKLAETFPDALTLIAPRHPSRGEAIRAELEAMGLNCALRSRGERPERETAVYICDTIGELGIFYRLAGVVMVGKSFNNDGGQNPIEAAKLACAILHGPHVANFLDVYALLDEAGGAALVHDADELAAMLLALFDDPSRLRTMARAAASAVEGQGGAADRVMHALTPLLPATPQPALA